MEKNYIPKEKIPRQYDGIYTKHTYYQQLKGDITYFYKEYKRIRHLFKHDEWVFVEKLDEETFNHRKFIMDQVCLPGAFDYHNLIIDGESYSDVGWD